jgi:hypothetical protein
LIISLQTFTSSSVNFLVSSAGGGAVDFLLGVAGFDAGADASLADCAYKKSSRCNNI